MKKIVMCFGAFDGLHAGHEDYLRQAKERGDELVVVVARDSTISDLKGEPPKFTELERLHVLDEHPLVDEARLGYEDDKYRIIEEIKPDVICLGHDQDVFTENLDTEIYRRGVSASIVRCEPYEVVTFKLPSYQDQDEEESFVEAEYEERGLPL